MTGVWSEGMCVCKHCGTLPIGRHLHGRAEEQLEGALGGGGGGGGGEVEAAVGAGGVRFEPFYDAGLVEGLCVWR